jgi:hypothetical protein
MNIEWEWRKKQREARCRRRINSCLMNEAGKDVNTPVLKSKGIHVIGA